MIKFKYVFYKIFPILFFGLVLICIHISCSPDKNKIDDIKVIKITFDDNNSLKFREYFSQVEIIPLETTPANLFSKITDIRVEKENIFVFSSAPDNMISIYSAFGDYLNSIRNVGRGPGEIIYATSFDVDTCIVILDRGNRKILNFSFDGKFISEINLRNLYFSKFSILKNSNNIALFDEIPSMQNDKSLRAKLTFWNYSNNMNIKQIAYAPDLNPGKEFHILLKNSFSTYKNSLFYWDVFNDTINRIDLSTYKKNAFQVLNFGVSKIPSSKLKEASNSKIQPNELLKILKEGYAFLYEYFYCQNDLQFFMIRKNWKDYTGFKKANECQMATFLKIHFDNLHKDLEVNITPEAIYPIYYDKQSFIYFSWGATDFINTFRNLKNKITSSEWNSLLDSNASLKHAMKVVKSDDNSIILKIKLK